jgi:hypothetical protein
LERRFRLTTLRSLEHGIAITTQEAWVNRGGLEVRVPAGRPRDQRADRVFWLEPISDRQEVRSHQRLPISTMENVISNASGEHFRIAIRLRHHVSAISMPPSPAIQGSWSSNMKASR